THRGQRPLRGDVPAANAVRRTCRERDRPGKGALMKILYLCADAGIPVLGRKGASVHVRELIAAFCRAGHRVVLATPLLNKSPWEMPEETAATLLHLRLSASTQAAVFAAKAFNERLGTENSLPSDLRRILYNQELQAELMRR